MTLSLPFLIASIAVVSATWSTASSGCSQPSCGCGSLCSYQYNSGSTSYNSNSYSGFYSSSYGSGSPFAAPYSDSYAAPFPSSFPSYGGSQRPSGLDTDTPYARPLKGFVPDPEPGTRGGSFDFESSQRGEFGGGGRGKTIEEMESDFDDLPDEPATVPSKSTKISKDSDEDAEGFIPMKETSKTTSKPSNKTVDWEDEELWENSRTGTSSGKSSPFSSSSGTSDSTSSSSSSSSTNYGNTGSGLGLGSDLGLGTGSLVGVSSGIGIGIPGVGPIGISSGLGIGK